MQKLGKRIAVGLVGLAAAASATLGVTAPAEAGVGSNGRVCVVRGSFGEWNAYKSLDGGRNVTVGPDRWFKTSAQHDCVVFLSGV